MKKVLIIDDNKMFRELLKKYLTVKGYHVSVAKDGKDGINLFRNACNFDVVITDVEMPIIDGIAFAHLIRTSGKPQTPILAITGAFDSLQQKEVFDLVIQKPFSFERLESVIKSFFR